jgi:glycosyltransferase involved in cell wall biosynthesis
VSGARRPVLLVTTEVPPDRVAPFRALHARCGIVVARFGGPVRHASAGVADPGVPVLDVAQRDVLGLAASGRYRAVVAGTVGRTALPAAYLGARRAGVPFVLWTALWAHPRTPAHALSLPLLRHLYRAADAVVTYGPHVSAYVARRGARNVHVAPQAVDPAFWGARADAPVPRPAGFHALFVGRPDAEKGVWVLLEAWRRAALPDAALTLVGGAPLVAGAPRGVRLVPARPPHDVRNFLAAADVLVVPSIATRAFREPWGLVANEAMHQSIPVIATDAVGAAAGGLVRHERTGLVVPARDAAALAGALARLAGDPAGRAALGATAARDVAAYTPEAWAAGMAAALGSVDDGRGHGLRAAEDDLRA